MLPDGLFDVVSAPLKHIISLVRGGRSAGIWVSGPVLRAVRRGDTARREANWIAAAAAYQRAIERAPGLAHIWLQLGHALKEGGRRLDAAAAYQRAADLLPGDPEPLLRLGHMLKASGDANGAARAFLATLQRSPGNLAAGAELVRLLPERAEADPDWWEEAMLALDINLADVSATGREPILEGSLFLDATDLFAYLGHARLPTGIQRVQIETLLAAADEAAIAASVCIYLSARRGWVLLPLGRVAALCRLSLASDDVGDPAWLRTTQELHVLVAVASTIRFPPGSILVNLGTGWSDPTYLADVDRERARAGLVYVPLVFDLIPILHPEWFVPSLANAFRGWLARLTKVADGYLAISAATRVDLIRNASADPNAVRVVRIDGDVRHPAERVDQTSILANIGLVRGQFVLMVSTVEPRKNHLGAFATWRRLADEFGAERLPKLVCVGGKGWLNAPVHAALARDPSLQRQILLLSGVADDALTVLYRACLFTLYPSFYEGWGLPISESLSYGKVPAVSRTSSMVEAGGDFAVYFDPHDPASIAAAVRPLLVDSVLRRTLEARIAAEYRGRSWAAIASQVAAEARAIAARSTANDGIAPT